MKNLSLWQKAGLFTLVGLPLALGLGLTIKNSKGLEGKIPSIGMSTVQAMKTNPNGYEVPTLINMPIISKDYVEDGTKYTAELFKTTEGKEIARLRIGNKIFAYDILGYTIVDNDGDGTFETKYILGESYPIPNWAKG